MYAYNLVQSILYGPQADQEYALHTMHVLSCLVSGLYQAVLA